MELQKGDEDPAPSSAAPSVTQSDFCDNLPNLSQNSANSFLLLNIFANILPYIQNFLQHNAVTIATSQPLLLLLSMKHKTWRSFTDVIQIHYCKQMAHLPILESKKNPK